MAKRVDQGTLEALRTVTLYQSPDIRLLRHQMPDITDAQIDALVALPANFTLKRCDNLLQQLGGARTTVSQIHHILAEGGTR